MFSRLLISMDGLLQESELLKLLKTSGVEILNSSLKSFSFDNLDFSKAPTSFRTYVTANRYAVRNLGGSFALSYSTVEENVTESRSLGSSKTYICVLNTDSSLALLQKLAYYFDTSIETYDIRDRDVPKRFIRNLI